MKRNALIAVVAVGITLVATGLWLVLQPPPAQHDPGGEGPRPNVVLIIMDAFRWDRLGAHRNGESLTPFLDSLAGRAAVFDSAVTPCTWTRPAMASLFTSLHVDTHQVYFGSEVGDGGVAVSDVLPDALPTMATVLRNAGYRTIGILANGNVSAEFGFAQGFDVYETKHLSPGTKMTEAALRSVAASESPFFLYVHYMDTHVPYAPPESYRAMVGFPPANISPEELAIATDFLDYYYQHCMVMAGRAETMSYPPLSETGREAVLMLYDAAVRYVDDEVRRLIETVQGRHPDTVFIITADHGEHFWDHGHLGHGLTMYNVELQVPLLLLGPGLTPGRHAHPVSLLDILPTIAARLGLPLSEGWQGRDLFLADPVRPVFSYTRATSPVWNTDCEMVLADGMKLIADRIRGRYMLFDWVQDPGEANDLASAHPDIVAGLSALLEEHRRANVRARRALRQQTQLDPETVERLRMLGYID